MTTATSPLAGGATAPAADPVSIARYRTSSWQRSLWQLVTTLTGFVAAWWFAWNFHDTSLGWTAIGVVVAAGFLLRLFVLAHDCGHGSFFDSPIANSWVGSALGVLTLTPYYRWRKQHAIHHATTGDLDRRGQGDVHMLTVREYLAMSGWQRWKYRVHRHPLILFGVGPFLYFAVWQRFVWEPREWRQERRSVHVTNAALAVLIALMCWWVGPATFFAIHIPVVALAASAGVWLFYVQHHFEDTYWRRHGEWRYADASLQGSSYYRLPQPLRWLTANIGLHHIHHLDSRIPNYRLQQCYDENPGLQTVPPLSLWASLDCARLRLWDEDHGRMVGLRQLRDIAGRQ